MGQWEGQDVPMVRPSSCIVKGGISSSRRYLPTYLRQHIHARSCNNPDILSNTRNRPIVHTFTNIDSNSNAHPR